MVTGRAAGYYRFVPRQRVPKTPAAGCGTSVPWWGIPANGEVRNGEKKAPTRLGAKKSVGGERRNVGRRYKFGKTRATFGGPSSEV
jgi:hypothetical protein